MLFNSYIFILFFLPVTLFLYFGLNRLGKEREAKWALTGMSLWFYGYFHVAYLLLLTGSILFNFVCSKGICRQKDRLKGKLFLAAGILVNVGLIFYFKYFNFFIENVNVLFHMDIALGKILMPLGISFFTFQQISYLVDSYRGETAGYSFVDYALFVTFFPQLIAGPIVLHSEMIPQFLDPSRKKLDQDKLARGIHLFAIGLFKKVMLADVLGRGVTWGYSDPEILTAVDVAVVSVLYTLQLYFDFSGYCDMACGIANMFCFDLPVNFDSPYKSTSISEFWQRWHMTLTRFLRTYIYFPLGGSRKGQAHTMANIMIVFLVSGIWHGAAWTFILWGVLHGIANVLYRLFRDIWEKFPKCLRWLMTFTFFDLTCIVFRAESIQEAGILFRKLCGPWEWRMSEGLWSQFDLLEFTYAEEHVASLGAMIDRFPAAHLAIVLAVALSVALVPRNCHEKKFVPNAGNAVGSAVLLVWSIVSLSGLTTFLYFNF
ncbi:MAG: MBOAT family protein [Eubacterium sp.]|nr:MBOAT family protein [Eubacterium sp.]MCM1216461.1 MBOAT family protein [Lachnospiraceae bacterium]MCM1304304.1 MBOAT family protein [Butyrivibrio sp.]MCM1344051.1 MBOAT family protein [Muribaculaceae bacterium]MCM1240273.1 MBOAT family protein [Lachnospiraceae bacterium]